MPRLLELIRSLGPSGATDNAGAVLRQRQCEDRVVEAIARHFAPVQEHRAA